jgi:glucose/arabinose dehydrogenase
MMFRVALSLFTVAILATSSAVALTTEEIEAKLKSIKLPDGFSIALYANGLTNARSLALGDKGTVFVGTRNEDRVYAVVDTNGDHRADETHVVFTLGGVGDGKERFMPNGVAFRDGDLYIATVNTIFRLDDIESHLSDPPKPVIVNESYPADRHHGWKFIAFGPDGKLYVPVGTPCNACDPEDDIYGTITRINADGSGREIVAEGVRNTLGFDWHPQTRELWFTENGADEMGDDIPADELNVVTAPGQHFGNPYIHQGDLPDPLLGAGHDPNDYVRPAINLGPHIAALGMRFYTGDMFPGEYKNQIFIAEHGSGGRETLVGYRIMLVRTDGKQATAYEEFATGWIEDNKAWGRPVDVAPLPDGSMLVSDDRAGAIYRITYTR